MGFLVLSITSHSRYTMTDPTDALWVLVCAALVFIMQPGFMCLESGLTRSKNNINVAAKNFADFALASGLFWLVGFGLMFGPSWLGIFGHGGFALDLNGVGSLAAFFLFQAMFCGTATTIVSGAVAERVRFGAYGLISCLISGLIYPIYGHWVWHGLDQGQATGWLGQMGFIDFAGSTVVHSVGGWVALAGLMVIGPRAGRFDAQGRPKKLLGSSLPLSVLGGMLLWFGWFGFNGGSALGLGPEVPRILTNTLMGGVSGLIGGLAIALIYLRRAEVDWMINGCLAGLVAITAGCHLVSTAEAVWIGAIGASVAIWVSLGMERWRLDDAVGAVPVHLGAGAWGTLAVALFGDPDQLPLPVLPQLGIQLLGVVAAGIWAFGLAYAVLRGMDPFWPLRVTSEAEELGLNIVEHGAKTEAYDLIQVMTAHSSRRDLHRRVPVEPFSELGYVGSRYNQVMDALASAQEEIQQLNLKLEAENQRMGSELELTRRLQQLILPKDRELQRIPGLDIAGFMEPATEVGGDYYDVLEHNGLVRIGIGDVTGHGLESGMLMLMAQTAVRTLAIQQERDPGRVLEILNQVIYENAQRMNSDRNMTLMLLDYHDGILRFSGQHEQIIVVRKEGSIERVDTLDLGFPIGLEADIRQFIAQAEVHLSPGDVVVLYTDGITEAENGSRDLFGLDRLCRVVQQHWQASAREICKAIITEVRQFIQGHPIFDDLTLVVIKKT
ncbi:MAG: ammonium transporter [Thermostichus sp. BF3_bins_97]